MPTAHLFWQKQAGLDIDYQYCNQPVKDAEMYFLPSVRGADVIDQHRMREVLQKVRDGATLYVSNDNGHIGPDFPEFTGLKVRSYTKKIHEDKVKINGVEGNLIVKADIKHILQAVTARVLAVDQDGKPCVYLQRLWERKSFFT